MEYLPKNWVETTLKEVNLRKTVNINPFDYPNEEFESYSVPVFETGKPEIVYGLEIKSSKQVVEGEEVLISKINPRINRVWKVGNYTEHRKICSSEWIIVDVKKVIDPDFLRYEFSAHFFRRLLQSEVSGVGGSLTRARPKIVENYLFPLPPLPEQQRIVAKLDDLFGHLEQVKNRLVLIPDLLKNFRQAILTQAVTGKLTEEWREGKELGTVLSKEIESIRNIEITKGNKELIDSGRRKQKITPFKHFDNNSYGWLTVNVESACLFIIDCLHNTPKFVTEGNYVVDTTCVAPFKINWDKARKVDDEFFEKWIERLKPSYGDILFSREGTIGIAVKVPKEVDICLGQRMMLYRMGSFINPEFAEIYFNSYAFRDEYLPHVKGVAAQHLNIGSVRTLKFPIPPKEEQAEIVSRVESLFAKADGIEAKYNNLKAQIDSLPQAILAKAFKGELVEQLPTDGNAKDLLEEIQKLKAEAQSKGKKKKSK